MVRWDARQIKLPGTAGTGNDAIATGTTEIGNDAIPTGTAEIGNDAFATGRVAVLKGIAGA
jgi:hypothetical protein